MGAKLSEPDEADLVPPQPYVPGLVFYSVTGAALALGLWGASVPGWDPLVVPIAFLTSVVIGIVWVVAFLVAATETHLRIRMHTWARWMLVPAAGILTAGLMLSGVPIRARFEMSRPAMQQAADRARAGQTYGPGWIGLMAVDDVYVDSSGNVIFVVTGTDFPFFGRCGYASGRETDRGHTVTEIAPGWWTWCEGVLGE